MTEQYTKQKQQSK